MSASNFETVLAAVSSIASYSRDEAARIGQALKDRTMHAHPARERCRRGHPLSGLGSDAVVRVEKRADKPPSVYLACLICNRMTTAEKRGTAPVPFGFGKQASMAARRRDALCECAHMRRVHVEGECYFEVDGKLVCACVQFRLDEKEAVIRRDSRIYVGPGKGQVCDSDSDRGGLR